MPKQTAKTPKVKVSKKDNQVVEATIVVLPGVVEEVAVKAGSTVAEAAQAASVETEGYVVRINGKEAALDTVLNNGDYVVLAPNIEGN